MGADGAVLAGVAVASVAEADASGGEGRGGSVPVHAAVGVAVHDFGASVAVGP